MRLMGLDVGDKTVGVALSDELCISAGPLKIIDRTGSVKKECGEVRRIAEEYGVGRIVVGMPYMLDGSVGIQAQKVCSFVEEMKKRVNIPIDTWDERLSSAEVERSFAEDAPRLRRGRRIDDLAAVVILRSYMERNEGAF